MPDLKKIHTSLEKHQVEGMLIEEIFHGINPERRYSKREQADHIYNVISKIDSLLDDQVKYEVLQWCACCKTGKRAKDIRDFVKRNHALTIPEKIILLSDVENMGKPKLISPNKIEALISWKENDVYKCPCPYFINQMIEYVSKTYCYCCAGHFKHHYSKALGVKVEILEICSTALNSNGTEPCRFIYNIP